MLNIAKIKNGIVIDHIKAGQGIRIFNWLGLGKAHYPVAFVVNASSEHMERKDIIKIDNVISIDFAVLGLIDPNITVNIIENEVITEKIRLKLPERVEGVLLCRNPRCVTSTEKYATQVFHLADEEKGAYRCEYCDETRTTEDFR
ncbi:MAG: aspartate carbamoyltransferase regulatory subunit [Treponema sp. RIFOXYC1_FULL_61_9]|nr:MAG: aspartate carbamoyltransferase regulatory subunit [Treponema sp. GWC1_61_84]OHE74705.1 MAG: aspartate carbamoyltransferase regulatory subunit [Treponema sp. RIFOXYC1_FULL_61_9]